MNLSFVTLISYDYKYAKDCILSYYDIADEIFLGIDINKKTWSGENFDIDMNWLTSFVNEIDKNKKIKIIGSDFYKFSKPIQNDTYERNFMSLLCKEGNWIISIDSDERVLNANEFKQWMDSADKNYSILATWNGVFKIINDKFFRLMYINTFSLHLIV